MAYNEQLGERIKTLLSDKKVKFVEKKMFGGIAFMIDDKMCVGISKNELMLRVLDEEYNKVLLLKHAKPMQFTGRIMKGFVFVEEEGFKTEEQLMHWIQYGLDFGKHGVVKSKKKK